jgi:hypothetical protein
VSIEKSCEKGGEDESLDAGCHAVKILLCVFFSEQSESVSQSVSLDPPASPRRMLVFGNFGFSREVSRQQFYEILSIMIPSRRTN